MSQRSTAVRLPRRSPVDGLRRRRLSFAEVLAQSVSALAPTAAMVVVPSIVLVEAGAGTLPAFVAATALVLLIGWCLTQFGRRMAAVGGTYSYTAKGLGPVGALVGGWALLVGYATVAMAALVGAALYLAGLLGLEPTPPVVALLGGAVGLLATAFAVRGIRLSARVALVLEVVSVALVVAVLGALLVLAPRTPGSAAPVVDAPLHWGGLAVGTVLGVTAFMGFESAAVLGVEARRPLVAVPRAVLWTPAVAGVLVFGAAVAQVVLLRAAPIDVLTSPVPVAELADRNGLVPLRRLLDLGIAASFFACVTGSTNALGRVLFSMAREEVLPRTLGRTHRRFDTPHRALAAVLPAVVGVPVLALALGARPRGVLVGALTVSAAGYVVAYVLACLAVPLFLRRIGELTPLPLAGGLVAGAAGLAVLTAAVAGAARGDGAVTAAVTVAALAPGVAWALWLRWRAPERLRSVGVYDQATVSSVLPGTVPAEPPR
ncbi:amino acid/polyamine/organocation transporter, APC superfamily (TC 2.A.3) [Geodermatophilus telluris]|uniref:Amino acid/polyamine/organocation transporter, APC superfamily (TC 2.A.3) n=1 Tax=Geodermatophilus telluris TaxID=1190417 RepID=A0A1G6MZ03_9ACTN|nr:APC family permease [Geodermatophilus telluris]SDC60216.1 amino acid/polyamine/organocation transporter, APC superfamily (TC 2.A.3) [Geodermatophilus telluris]